MSKNKKIVFSEKIDNTIDGYALGITFLLIAIFIIFEPSYFGKPIISYIIGAVIGFIGIIGFSIEISKTTKLNGMDDFLIGIVFISIWFIVYANWTNILLNIIIFFVLIIGIYGALRGIIKIVYSIFSNRTIQDAPSKTILFKDIFLFIVQISGLILTVLSILNILGIVKNTGG